MIKPKRIRSVVVALLTCLLIAPSGMTEEDSSVVTSEILAEALKLIGLEYTEAERDSALDELNDNLEGYQAMREVRLDNSTPPALYFNPVPARMSFDGMDGSFELSPIGEVKRPDDINELAFYSVRELGELIRTGKVTSVELTELCLRRLKEHDSKLHCVISLTEELAMKQAARADAEIAAGRYRGPLHGIPYGAKDLLAHPDYLTTWGATPYKEQQLDQTATVIRKLEEAGAVYRAALSSNT